MEQGKLDINHRKIHYRFYDPNVFPEFQLWLKKYIFLHFCAFDVSSILNEDQTKSLQCPCKNYFCLSYPNTRNRLFTLLSKLVVQAVTKCEWE